MDDRRRARPGHRRPDGHGPPGGPPPWARGGDHGHAHDWTEADWRRMRGRFVRFVVVAVLLLAAVLGLAGAGLAALLGGGPGPVRGLGGVVALLVVLALLGRMTARWARPIGGVVTAADRIAAGDLAARAEESGPGAVRRLAASFNGMAERLESDDARRRALLADVAHELRTPLSVVRGNLEGVVDGLYEADPARLERVLSELARADRLLDDLRTLSNADAGALTLEVEEVSLGPLLQGSVDLHRPRADAAGVALTVHVQDGIPTVDGDPVRLAQVVGNLVDNALRHAGGRSAVAVTARHDGDQVLIEVVDDGGGLRAEVAERAFDRYVTAGDAGGTGLGLAIVRRLVEAHGGTADLSSRADAPGTIVTVRLPAAG